MKSFILLCSLFISSIVSAQIADITVTDAFQQLSNGTFLLDVREDDELIEKSFDLDNLLTVPLSEIDERYSELDKDQEIIVSCRSGMRSKQAIKKLQDYGFTKLKNLDGGILAWEDAGYGILKEGKASGVKCSASTKKQCSSKTGNSKSTCCSAKERAKCCSKKIN